MIGAYEKRRDATLAAVPPPSQTMRDEIGFRAWWAMWAENSGLFTNARRVRVIRERGVNPSPLTGVFDRPS